MYAGLMSSDLQAGPGLLVDLVNTRYLPREDDVLSDDRALAWLNEHGGAGGRVDLFALDALRRFREGLRQLALGNNGMDIDVDTLDRARASLASVGLFAQLGDMQEAPTMAAPTGAGPAQQVLARVATTYFAERAGGSWRRVKACAALDCQFAYHDTSRNASRRWCDMSECGNRAKNRSWRARRGGAPG